MPLKTGCFVRCFPEESRRRRDPITDGLFDGPVALAADGADHLLVLDGTPRLQVFDGADGTHLLTRSDLGIEPSSYKGIEWDGLLGRLAIANGGNALLFEGGMSGAGT